MAKIVPLFSSSRGNSYYIQGNSDAILIDAGRNCKQIELALSMNGLSMENVRAIFVTHEHSDHISALNVLLKRYKLPLFATQGTLEELASKNILPAGANANVIENTVFIGDFAIRRVETSHDARESCGYFITTPDRRNVSVVTDTGYLTDSAKAAIGESHCAVVESNHDIEMLKNGGYPYIIKKRILSDYGHLSNLSCAEALPSFVEQGLTRIILAHLSAENNMPKIALDEAVSSLAKAQMKRDSDYMIDVASPDCIGKSMVF